MRLLLPALISLISACASMRTASQLDEILAAKKIRIGTTEDYRPFSYRDASGDLQGIDIELAKELAESLEAQPVFVKTSWPTLMRDLEGNRFDVAITGISKDLGRQRRAFFSTGYLTSGKTPISRCEDAKKFDSLGKIDRPEITVIVNPGGTNQKFVSTHLKRAKILIHPENTTIFQQIIDKKADVMITDSTEASLQARLHEELCRPLPTKTFDQFEKGILMPRDPVLKNYVDEWLRQMETRGKLREVLSRYEII